METLPYDYDIKDVKVHTFKLKHEDIEEKETFNVKILTLQQSKCC
jgi:hypothetical protein